MNAHSIVQFTECQTYAHCIILWYWILYFKIVTTELTCNWGFYLSAFAASVEATIRPSCRNPTYGPSTTLYLNMKERLLTIAYTMRTSQIKTAWRSWVTSMKEYIIFALPFGVHLIWSQGKWPGPLSSVHFCYWRSNTGRLSGGSGWKHMWSPCGSRTVSQWGPQYQATRNTRHRHQVNQWLADSHFEW